MSMGSVRNSGADHPSLWGFNLGTAVPRPPHSVDVLARAGQLRGAEFAGTWPPRFSMW
jgi:hypothetical protein